MYSTSAFNKSRKLRKYQYGGDPNRDAIYGSTSAIAQTGLNIVAPGLGTAYGAVTGLTNSLTTNADGTFKSGAAGAVNYVVDPLSFVSDVATGNFMKKKEREAAEELMEQQRNMNIGQGVKNLKTAIGAGYSQTGYKDVMFRKYGGSLRRYAMGANIQNPQYEVENQEIVEGGGVQLEGQEKLASDMTKAVGPTHEEGGIEGEGGDRVYSERIKLSKEALESLRSMGFKTNKTKVTIADAAEFIARKQKVYEDLSKSSRVSDNNTSKLMLERIEQAKELIFQDQEVQKELSQERVGRAFAKGGNLPKYEWGKDLPDYSSDVLGDTSVEDDANKPKKDYTPYIGYGVNALNYFQNLSAIDKLKTDFNPTLPSANYKIYNDRSGAALNRINASLNTGIRGLRYSSSRSRNAAIAGLTAQTYEPINQVVNAENARRDGIYGSNVDTSNNFALARTTIYNKAMEDNMARNNEKIATKVQATNAMLDGSMKQARELRDSKFANDKMSADVEAKKAEMKLMLLSDKTGVADVLMESYEKEKGFRPASQEELVDWWINKNFTFGNKKSYGGYLKARR